VGVVKHQEPHTTGTPQTHAISPQLFIPHVHLRMQRDGRVKILVIVGENKLRLVLGACLS
jgi:hypothetical protein